jgi:hypothetical protein
MVKGRRFRKVVHLADEGGFLFPGKPFWASFFTPGGRNEAVKGFAKGKLGDAQPLRIHPMLISGF